MFKALLHCQSHPSLSPMINFVIHPRHSFSLRVLPPKLWKCGSIHPFVHPPDKFWLTRLAGYSYGFVRRDGWPSVSRVASGGWPWPRCPFSLPRSLTTFLLPSCLIYPSQPVSLLQHSNGCPCPIA